MEPTYIGIDISDSLAHYGMPRRSGRYPWGSGKEPFQHRRDFASRVDGLKKEGYSDKDIALIMGYETPKELHYQLRLAKEERTRENISHIEEMRNRGLTYSDIAKELGISNESTVRSIIDQKEDRLAKAQIAGTINLLRDTIDKHGALDVGEGVENQLGITRDTLNTAIYALTGEGYQFYNASMPNATNPDPNKNFTLSIVGPPGMEYKDAYDYANVYHIKVEEAHSEDGGKTFRPLEYPASLDSKRLQVVYKEDGGEERDGLVEIRPGLKDLSMGESLYSQVRILVDGDKYIKGMAVYNDELPPGIDVRFNSNKSKELGLDKALKDIDKENPVNPFGSDLKLNGQNHYVDKDGKERLGLINKVKEEGVWEDYAEGVAAQFLSKQSPALIKHQLEKSIEDFKKEYNEIQSLSNNALRKSYLEDFAGHCDETSASLKASSIKGQSWKVILPDPNLKDSECYCPTYPNGTRLSLIRYPHGAIFEIPEVVVNNNVKSSEKMIGKMSTDAMTINKRVADRLSGADFDGDTVLAIPTGRGATKIISANTPESLIGYDPKDKYTLPFANDKAYRAKLNDYYELSRKEKLNQSEIAERLGISKAQVKQLAVDSGRMMRNTNNEMGRISNLITDMTVKGADTEEIVRAVKHSMTVIDAEKHCLDYKKSAEENRIKELKQKYQAHEVYDETTGLTKTSYGVSTIISRAKSETTTPKRVGSPRIDPETGDLIWKEKIEYYTDKSGKEKMRTTSIKSIDKVKDAYSLYGGGGEKELLYVDYANSLKDLAREARKEIVRVPNVRKDPKAAEKYKNEVAQLNARYEKAMRNKPKEREANMIANAQIIQAKRDAKKAGIKLDSDTIKKLANKATREARESVGADSKGTKIQLTPREWEAIQAGAISTSRFSEIIKKCDKDALRKLALPKSDSFLSSSEISRIRAMANRSDVNLAEIAQKFGVSVSTVKRYIE